MATRTLSDPGQGGEPIEGWEGTRGTRVQRHRRPPWYRRASIVILAVTALGGGLRFYHLSSPHGFVFDEVYYAKDGCFDAGFDYRKCQLESPSEQTAGVHPPLGRWIIAAGARLLSKPSDFDCTFGTNRPACHPFGWRASAALFGTISILLVSLLALRMFESVLWAGVAGLLLATDGLHFVQSRVAMLDILVTTFALAGFLFLVLDRQWVERRSPRTPAPAEDQDESEATGLLGLPPDRPPAPILRPWRIAAGLAFGAAIATKWSGATALLGAIVLALVWERSRRKAAGFSQPWREVIRDESFGIFAFLVLLPAAVYMASYAKWFLDHHWSLRDWWALQHSMASFSLHLRATHPYASKAWSWLIMQRPVSYYYRGDPAAKTSAAILAIGNPAIFWSSLLSLPYALYSWIRKRDWRPGMIVVAFSFQYFPWFAAARTDFFFYMLPMTPFMVLAGVYGLKAMSEFRVGADRLRAFAPGAAFLVLLAVGLFAFFFPILTGRTIPTSAWQQRMWFPGWI